MSAVEMIGTFPIAAFAALASALLCGALLLVVQRTRARKQREEFDRIKVSWGRAALNDVSEEGPQIYATVEEDGPQIYATIEEIDEITFTVEEVDELTCTVEEVDEFTCTVETEEPAVEKHVVRRSAHRRRSKLRPGHRALLLVELLVSEESLRVVFVQQVGDMRQERLDALRNGERWGARRVYWRWAYRLLVTLASYSASAFAKKIVEKIVEIWKVSGGG